VGGPAPDEGAVSVRPVGDQRGHREQGRRHSLSDCYICCPSFFSSLTIKILQYTPHPGLFAHSVPVYPHTFAASSSPAWPLAPGMFAHSVPVYPHTFAVSSSLAWPLVPL